jgi:hypothetical protein
LEYCKRRAFAYADRGDYDQALASMESDLNAHPETEKHSGVTLGLLLLMSGDLRLPGRMQKFIEGFR